MKPVILLVGRLPGVVETVARQLEAEPAIACVVIGAGLDDRLRGELIGVITARRPDITIHLKDQSSGPAGMAGFVRRVVGSEVLR